VPQITCMSERHKSPYRKAQSDSDSGPGGGRGSQLCITSSISARYPPQKTGSAAHGRIQIQAQVASEGHFLSLTHQVHASLWGKECSAATDMGMGPLGGPWGSGEG
jgi:hypothetical protein